MALISLKDVSVNFPIYGAGAASFKKTLAASVTGGRFGKETGVNVVQALSSEAARAKPMAMGVRRVTGVTLPNGLDDREEQFELFEPGEEPFERRPVAVARPGR